MDDSRRWSLRAALVFGAVASGAASTYELGGTVLGNRWRLRDGLTPADLAVFEPVELLRWAGTGAVAGALVGGLVWAVVVERRSRSSIRRRGVIAGVVAGALAIPVWITLLRLAQGVDGGLRLHAVLLFFVLLSVVGGLLTTPIGAVTGYLLARWRGGDATPE